MNGSLILLIILGVGILVGMTYYTKHKMQELVKEGIATDRGNFDYFQQCHTFYSSKVANLNMIGDEIDQSVLRKREISFEPDYSQGEILFRNNISFGTFVASIESLGVDEKSGLNVYEFQNQGWRERKNTISRQDLLNSNVLLTAIEKAFLKVDSDVTIKRERAKFKQHSRLF